MRKVLNSLSSKESTVYLLGYMPCVAHSNLKLETGKAIDKGHSESVTSFELYLGGKMVSKYIIISVSRLHHFDE